MALNAMAFDHRFDGAWLRIPESQENQPPQGATRRSWQLLAKNAVDAVMRGVRGALIVDERAKTVWFLGTEGQAALSTPLDKITALWRWEGGAYFGGWRGYLTLHHTDATGRKNSEIVVFRDYPGYYLPAALESLETQTGLKAQQIEPPVR